jgi:signal transduction histidine kinase
METVPFSLRALVSSLVREYQTVALRKGVQAICRFDHLLPDALHGDPHRIRQVCWLLLLLYCYCAIIDPIVCPRCFLL